MDFSPQQDEALKAVGALAEGRQAAALPPVRLCRHRQDHAGPLFRRACRWPSPVRRLHRQGRAGAAFQGRGQCAHHPFADLPAARRGGGGRRGDRQDLDLADLRAQPPEPGGARQADRRRRMLDGRRGAGPRSDELRHADPGARRSRPAAADLGRRLFHRSPARRAAHRGPSAGPRQPDPAPGARRPRGAGSPARRLRHRAGDRPRPRRPRSGAARRPGAGRHEPHPAALQSAPARAQGLRRGLSAGRRQARLPAQRPGQGPAQRRRCGR